MLGPDWFKEHGMQDPREPELTTPKVVIALILWGLFQVWITILH